MRGRFTLCRTSVCRVIFHIYLVLYISSGWLVKANSEESPVEATQWIPTGNGNQKITGVTIDPEGRILAYVRHTEGNYELRIKYLKDRGFGINILKHENEIASPVFSPDGKSIVFSMKKNGFSKIYKKDLRSNAEPQQITQGRSNDFHPSISPDGLLIAFDSDRSGNFDIWMLHLESYQRTQVTRYKNHDFYPRFSPDGSSLVYTSFRNEFFNLFMKNLNIPSSQPIQLTQEEAVQAHPTFSHDGAKVYFDSNMSGSNQIFSLNIENMEVYQVSEGDGTYSSPVESQGVLVYLAEEYGVFGVKKQSASSKAQSRWPKLKKKEFQALSKVVKNLKADTKADFEKDLLRVREQQATVIPSVETPAIGQPFERAGFELGFLEDRKSELVQRGILTNGTDNLPIEQQTSPMQEEAFLSNQKSKIDLIESPARLPQPRSFESVENATPLEKLWANASPSISIQENTSTNEKEEIVSDQYRNPQVQRNNDPLREHFSPKMPDLVQATFPSTGEQNVPVYQPLGIVYNRELYEGEQKFMNARLFEGPGDKELEVRSVYNKALKRVDIIPAEGLKKGTDYRIAIGNTSWSFGTEGKKDIATNLNAASVNVKSLQKEEVANLPLRVKRVFPRNRSRGNSSNTPIQVEFNQKIDPATLHASSLSLYSNGQMVPGEMIFEDNDKVLTLKPYRNLGEAEVYEARVSPDLKSRSGEVLSGKSQWKFKTKYFSPFLVSEFPPSIIDKQDQTINIVFNREIDPRSLKSDEYFLQSNNFRYKGRVELTNSNRTLRFTPHQRIPDQQEFKLYLSPNLTDTDGNSVDNARPISLASRFPQGGESNSNQVMQRARNYYPKSNVAQNGEQDLLLLESFFAKGYIRDRRARNVSQSQSTSRYKIALMIEEAIENLGRMKKQERRDLKLLIQKYEQELKNLGVDVKSMENNLSGVSGGNFKNNAFTSRGRRL